MDNAYQALIMAGAVLLFVIGISVAVYNYNRVMRINNEILTNSSYYDRNAENFQFTEFYTTTDGLNREDLKRIYSGAQVAQIVLNMYTLKTEIRETASITPAEDGSTTRTFTTQDIAYSEITIETSGGSIVFKKDKYEYSEIRSKIANVLVSGKGYYLDKISYYMDADGKHERYRAIFKEM